MRGITLLVEDPQWRKHRGLVPRLTDAARIAAAAARLKGGFTILLAGNGRLRALNLNFRGKDRPTNVLSFPGVGGIYDGRAAGRLGSARLAAAYAGDIALAYGVTQKEAKAAGKTVADHATHLVVHGVLHLAGHDHERPKETRAMESLEVKILAGLGIADPYAALSA